MRARLWACILVRVRATDRLVWVMWRPERSTIEIFGRLLFSLLLVSSTSSLHTVSSSSADIPWITQLTINYDHICRGSVPLLPSIYDVLMTCQQFT